MTISTAPLPTQTSRAAVRRRRALTVAAATAAATAVWLVARAAGTEPTVIGLPIVVVTALAASLAGWVAVSALERLIRQPRPWWPAVALAALAASFLPILSGQADGATRITLTMLHIAVAAVLIPGLLPNRQEGTS